MVKKPSTKRSVTAHAIVLLGYAFATITGMIFGGIIGMVFGAAEGPKILGNFLMNEGAKEVKSKALQVREESIPSGG